MSIARPLEKIENFDKLQQEVVGIIDKVGFVMNQIILQSLVEGVEEWHVGIGAIEELEEADERKYCYLNPSIEDSELGKIIKKYNGYRARIMLMPPRRCYSVHRDIGVRMHIPIVTNDQSWMVWPFDSHCVRLKPGFLYVTDTTKNHTFINGGTTDRIHVVICV